MSTYPIEFKDLEEENAELQAENKRLKAIKIEAQKLVDEFDKIGRYQSQRLGHGLKEACQNWGEASDVGGMIDFVPLKQVLQEKP